MQRTATIVVLLLALGAPSGTRGREPQKDDQASQQAKATEQLAFSLGTLAYIYGYPLVRMEQVKRQALSQAGVSVNEFRHRRKLTTPQDRNVVSPNNDTVYSSAWLDLSDEPVILHTPAAGGRYCSYALYDAYTNNFKVLSKRNSGDVEADYAIVGPRWQGALPQGVTRIDSPTNSAWLLVRTLIVDEQDWPGVKALQERMKLETLSVWKKQTTPATGSAKSVNAPEASQANRDPLGFFEQMGTLMQCNPPPASEATLVNQFSAIGLTVKHGFDQKNLVQAAKAGLIRALAAGRQIITSMKGDQTLERSGGWLVATKGGSFGDDYLFRAIIAEKGIGQLVPEEAAYLVTDIDGDGRPLNGENSYVLRFPKGQLPPAFEFWSLTLYAADFFFVENAINRYSLGDRSRGLKYGTDGSLTIYIQPEPPIGNEANWLPAPRADFNLNLRAYLPKPELLNNSYRPPAVQRVK